MQDAEFLIPDLSIFVIIPYKQIKKEVIMTKIKNKLFAVAVLATSTFAVTALSVSSVLANTGG